MNAIIRFTVTTNVVGVNVVGCIYDDDNNNNYYYYYNDNTMMMMMMMMTMM